MLSLHALLPRLLRVGGRYSYFNGIAAHDAYLHLVYCRLLQADLEARGFRVDWVPVRAAPDEGEWEGVSLRHWWPQQMGSTYWLPVATRLR